MSLRRKVNDEEIAHIKERLHIPENKRIILYVGRLVELKGIEYLLKPSTG